MLAPRTPYTTELSGIHVANETKLPSLLASLCILGVLSFTRSANLVHCFILGRKGTSVSLQNRSVVSANFDYYQGRQLAGFPHSFCSSVCVDNSTRMQKSGEECRAALPSTQYEEQKKRGRPWNETRRQLSSQQSTMGPIWDLEIHCTISRLTRNSRIPRMCSAISRLHKSLNCVEHNNCYNDRIWGNGRFGWSVTVIISVCTADSGLLVVSQVFETFGPMKKPYYSIRVNSPDHVTSLGLTPNTVVYFVTGNLEMTRFIFTKKLVR